MVSALGMGSQNTFRTPMSTTTSDWASATPPSLPSTVSSSLLTDQLFVRSSRADAILQAAEAQANALASAALRRSSRLSDGAPLRTLAAAAEAGSEDDSGASEGLAGRSDV
jgi:hypothetical protein